MSELSIPAEAIDGFAHEVMREMLSDDSWRNEYEADMQKQQAVAN